MPGTTDAAMRNGPPAQPPRGDDSLCEALDRLLAVGAVVDGNVMVSVADIDLLYLDLRVMLSSFETALRAGVEFAGRAQPPKAADAVTAAFGPSRPVPPAAAPVLEYGEPSARPGEPFVGEMAAHEPWAGGAFGGREPDGRSLPSGLARLVLALVNLLHELLERQALRRMEGGSLSAAEIERLGDALMRQGTEIQRLRDFFGLTREETNLSLGTFRPTS